MQPAFMIFGYSLDWWVSAVIIPVGLGVRWYLNYRKTGAAALISSQQVIIQQLIDVNSSQQQMLAQERQENSELREYIKSSKQPSSMEPVNNERDNIGNR